MTKIENFKTGIPSDNDAEIINIEPKENLENKKKIRIFLKNIAEGENVNINENGYDALLYMYKSDIRT